MKENKEFERNDLEVGDDIQIDDNDPHCILAAIEIWCKVKTKFNVTFRENTTLDMYALYNPFADTLQLNCALNHDDPEHPNEYFTYTPSADEETLIKSMISEAIGQKYGQTPQEYCEEAIQETQNINFGGME